MKHFILLLCLLSISITSCSSDRSNDSDDIITLQVNNVYLEDPTVNSNTQCVPNGLINNNYTIDCWRDVIITDGTYTQSNSDNNFYPDNTTTYIIHFLDLQLVGDFSAPNIYEQLYDVENHIYSNQGTEGLIFYTDIKVENGEYKSSTDLTETEGYVKFTLISENNFSFYIEMIDGRIFQGSYSGPVNILNQEYGFVPDIYWEDN